MEATMIIEGTEMQEPNKRKTWEELSEGARQQLCRYYVGEEVQQSLTPLIDAALRSAGTDTGVDNELELSELLEMFHGTDYQAAAEAEGWSQDEGTDYFIKAGDDDDAEHCKTGGEFVGWSCIAEDEVWDEEDENSESRTVFTFERGDDPSTRTQIEADDADEAWIELRSQIGFDAIEENDDGLCDDWEDLCRHHRIDTDDYQREPYEYWLVSDRMYRNLGERGYLVGEWMCLSIWGRECTGQAISLDSVVRDICAELYNTEYYFPDYVLERINE